MVTDKEKELFDRETEWVGDSKFRLYLHVVWEIFSGFVLFLAVCVVIVFVGPVLLEATWPVALLMLFFVMPIIELWKWWKERKRRVSSE